jgi:integrase/recombinase XerC
MRPGEVFALQWQHLVLNAKGGLIRIAEGKSSASRRVLPMTPHVYALLQTRYKVAGRPSAGWVFPSGASEGHLNRNATKDLHAQALEDSRVEKFEPYILRHTALTNLARKGADAHTLARIAGHSSIVITMRYVHPQADAIERAFAMAHGRVKGKRLPNRMRRGEHGDAGVGTQLGTTRSGERTDLVLQSMTKYAQSLTE